MMKINRFALGALILLASLGANASAQIGDSGEPIQVTADDSAQFLRDQGRLIYTKNVRAVQGGTEIKSDVLTIICSRKEGQQRTSALDDCSEIESVIAEGNVIYVTPLERIRGDRGEYDYRTDTITITGNVIMSRGQDGVAKGTKVVYEVTNGRATITSEGSGSVVSIFKSVENESGAN